MWCLVSPTACSLLLVVALDARSFVSAAAARQGSCCVSMRFENWHQVGQDESHVMTTGFLFAHGDREFRALASALNSSRPPRHRACCDSALSNRPAAIRQDRFCNTFHEVRATQHKFTTQVAFEGRGFDSKKPAKQQKQRMQEGVRASDSMGISTSTGLAQGQYQYQSGSGGRDDGEGNWEEAVSARHRRFALREDRAPHHYVVSQCLTNVVDAWNKLSTAIFWSVIYSWSLVFLSTSSA